MAFGLGGWLLSVTGAAERALVIAARFRMYVAQPSAFQMNAAQPAPIAMKAAQPRAFVAHAAQPAPFRLPVAGFQTEFESEEVVAKKIWTDDIDEAVDAMADGVFLYKTGGIWSATALTMDMIGPAFAVSMGSNRSLRLGQSLATPSFTATYTSTPTTAALTDSEGTPSKNVISTPTAFTSNGTFAYSVAHTATFTLTTGNGSATDTDAVTATWYEEVFYGSSASATYNEAFIEGLSSSVLTNSRAGSYSITVGSGEHAVICMPAAFGTPSFVLNGLGESFALVATVSRTNAYGVVTSMNVYRHPSTGLGECVFVGS